MTNHLGKRGGETSSFAPQHYVERPSLGEFFEPQGAFDGKLLFKDDKITFVFLELTDVVSIHFDKARKEIFYKGHHATNVELTEMEWLHLEKFRQSIEANPKTKDEYLIPYEEALQDLARIKG